MTLHTLQSEFPYTVYEDFFLYQWHSPNFHIHVAVSDLCIYSHDRSAYSAAGNMGIYQSLTDT